MSSEVPWAVILMYGMNVSCKRVEVDTAFSHILPIMIPDLEENLGSIVDCRYLYSVWMDAAEFSDCLSL